MVFYSLLKALVGQPLSIELKNGICLSGCLTSVDQFLNLRLSDLSVENCEKTPLLSSMKSVFVRGSVVQYVHLPKDSVDLKLLEDATRRIVSS
ncbi:hypothetical protein GEMRC1_013660 [Eukaryota sp. GEM-RC1]